jgi:hypothetical protein
MVRDHSICVWYTDVTKKYRVIHKSVKNFKNSQQINYISDNGNSYADRERISPSFSSPRVIC